MNSVRRSLLVSIFTGTLGGCVSRVGHTSNETEQDNGRNMTESGQDQALTVERIVEGDGVKYFEGNNSVRYRSGTQSVYGENRSEPTQKPEYSTIPFSQWAQTKCATIAADALTDHLKQEFERSLVGISGVVDHSGDGKEVYVDYSVTRNRKDEIVEEPEISFEEIVSATPKRITVTVTFAGKEHEETYDIYVQESTKIQQ